MAALIPPGIDPCTVALVLPPNGSPPNLYGYHPEELESLALAVFLIALVSVVVAARTCVNWGKFRLSDYCTFIAYTHVVTFLAVFLSLHKYHRSIWDIPACWFDESYLKRYYIQLLILGPALFFAKGAIQLLYFEVFSHNIQARRWLYGSLIYSGIIYSSFIPIASYFNAPHVGQTWSQMVDEIEQIDTSPVFGIWSITIGATSAILDIYIFVFPIVLLRDLHVSTAKKIQLLGVFSVGILGVSASLSSLSYRVRLFHHELDVSILQTTLGITNMFEASIAILIGCTPACAAFCREFIAPLPIWGFILRSIGLSKLAANTAKRTTNTTSGTSWPQSRTPNAARPLSQHTDEYELLHQIQAVRSAGPSNGSSAPDDASTAGGFHGITKTIDIVQYSSSRPTSMAGKTV